MLPELSRSMLKNSLVLALFAAVTVAVVAITQQSTESRIVAEERAAQVRALGEILPAHSYDNALLDHVIYLNESLLGHRKDTPAYLASLNGQPAAVILQANAPDGYSGTIQLLIGIMADGTLSGVRVTQHKETPGLGDRIDLAKSPWIKNFDGKSLSNPKDGGWAVKKDHGEFDQFAGATITPRAVVTAVHKALRYFDQNHTELFAHLKTTEASQ
ncbi:MAG: electron transport complex subunit RsxG [Pseudomonas sp.]|jgi:electron transport complex protein RnfG|nr:electron transport complex subunit RsxG [Pseudomonas sp.]MDD2223593.1 electron transport complex subunit RsxG [Pseudomonas sp.]MDY0414872.1 electron transport complex subunit RsxG [Pseudomonas sp.]NLO53683.1 electron transport complex subunit RsxG [Gammaproteobacteria bacterium]